MTLYKVLNEDGTAYHGGRGAWPLPHDGQPGDWLEVKGQLVPCENGLHLCREQDLVGWLGPAIYEAEYEGEMVEHEDKVVVRKARLLRRLDAWNERTARLFACDCAERMLSIYERDYPGDQRPRQAVEVARRYANGQATQDELAAARVAAGAAAWDAAWAAAWVAARATERQWQTGRLMEYLAGQEVAPWG